MGADILRASFKGKMSKTYIARKIKKRAEVDRQRNGHQNGYAGDWASVEDIKIISDIFKTEDDAIQYLEDNLEKWGPAIVVYYLTKDPKQCTIKTIVSAMVAC